MATTVSANGTNWYRPSSHICFTSAGLASLTPVTSRIAARQDSGIRFSHVGQEHDADQQQDAVDDRRELRLAAGVDVHGTADDDRRDRQSADQPDDHVADALSQQFPARRRVRCCGSILSTASRFSSVSSEATVAIVTAAV